MMYICKFKIHLTPLLAQSLVMDIANTDTPGSPWRKQLGLKILEFPAGVDRLWALSARIAAARPLTSVEQVQRFYRPLPGDPPPPPCIYKNTRLQWKLHRDNTLQLRGTRAWQCVALGAKTLPPHPSQLSGYARVSAHLRLACKKPNIQ